MRHFLLIYDVDQERLVAPPRGCRRASDALAAYAAAEEKYRNDPAMQVVLVASDSIETVMVTHGNFFRKDSYQDLVRDLLQEASAAVH